MHSTKFHTTSFFPHLWPSCLTSDKLHKQSSVGGFIRTRIPTRWATSTCLAVPVPTTFPYHFPSYLRGRDHLTWLGFSPHYPHTPLHSCDHITPHAGAASTCRCAGAPGAWTPACRTHGLPHHHLTWRYQHGLPSFQPTLTILALPTWIADVQNPPPGLARYTPPPPPSFYQPTTLLLLTFSASQWDYVKQ